MWRQATLNLVISCFLLQVSRSEELAPAYEFDVLPGAVRYSEVGSPISRDGRWFRQSYRENGRKFVRLYKLTDKGSREFRPREKLAFSYLPFHGGWYSSFAYSSEVTKSGLPISRWEIWNLNASDSQHPTVISADYSYVCCSLDGTCIFATRKGDDGLTRLSGWPNTGAEAKEIDYGPILSANQSRLIHFEKGVAAMTPSGVKYWGLGDLQAAGQISFERSKSRALQFVPRAGGMQIPGRRLQPSNYLGWPNERGKGTITDLPVHPTNPTAWEIGGWVKDGICASVDDGHLVVTELLPGGETRERMKVPYDRAIYAFSSSALLGDKLLYCEAYSLQDSPWTGSKSVLFDLKDGTATPFVLQDIGKPAQLLTRLENHQDEVNLYFVTETGSWLAAKSGKEVIYWDLRTPGSSKTIKGIRHDAKQVVQLNNRWLIVLDEAANLYSIDLLADEKPEAIFFNKLKVDAVVQRASNRFLFVTDKESKRYLIWKDSQFDKL